MSGPTAPRDHYRVLGVPPSATQRQITAAYRRLVRGLHPDTGHEPRTAGAVQQARQTLAEVLDAYETLRDPARRAAYDTGRTADAGRPAGPARVPARPVPVRVRRRTAGGTAAGGAPLRAGPVRIGPAGTMPPDTVPSGAARARAVPPGEALARLLRRLREIE